MESDEAAPLEPSTAPSSRIPLYVTPFYDSEGPQVEVGTFSEALATVTEKSTAKLSQEMKSQWDTLPIEAMYVMAVRLYDFGYKQEAVYWFYAAQFRARLFLLLLPENALDKGIGSESYERAHAHNAFFQLAGEYINGYAFGDMDKLQETIHRVCDESVTVPRFDLIYPEIEFSAMDSWQAKGQEVIRAFEEFSDHIANDAEKIKALRKENDIEGKY